MNEKEMLKKEIFNYAFKNKNTKDNKIISLYDIYNDFYYSMRNLKEINKQKDIIKNKFNFLSKIDRTLFDIDNIKGCNNVYIEIFNDELCVCITYNDSLIVRYMINSFNNKVDMLGNVLPDIYTDHIIDNLIKLLNHLEYIAKINNYNIVMLDRELENINEYHYLYQDLDIKIMYNYLGYVDSKISFVDNDKNDLLNSLSKDDCNLVQYLDSHKVEIMKNINATNKMDEVISRVYNQNEFKRQKKIRG